MKIKIKESQLNNLLNECDVPLGKKSQIAYKRAVNKIENHIADRLSVQKKEK